jgi:hypothetical protein
VPESITTDNGSEFAGRVMEVWAEEKWGTGTALPLSPGPVPEQHRGTRSPRHQTTRQGKSGLPIISSSGENDPGLGDGEHDPQGANAVAAKDDIVGQVAFVADCLISALLPDSVRSADR